MLWYKAVILLFGPLISFRDRLINLPLAKSYELSPHTMTNYDKITFLQGEEGVGDKPLTKSYELSPYTGRHSLHSERQNMVKIHLNKGKKGWE